MYTLSSILAGLLCGSCDACVYTCMSCFESNRLIDDVPSLLITK